MNFKSAYVVLLRIYRNYLSHLYEQKMNDPLDRKRKYKPGPLVIGTYGGFILRSRIFIYSVLSNHL